MTHTKTEKQNNQLSDLEKTDHNKKQQLIYTRLPLF